MTDILRLFLQKELLSQCLDLRNEHDCDMATHIQDDAKFELRCEDNSHDSLLKVISRMTDQQLINLFEDIKELYEEIG